MEELTIETWEKGKPVKINPTRTEAILSNRGSFVPDLSEFGTLDEMVGNIGAYVKWADKREAYYFNELLIVDPIQELIYALDRLEKKYLKESKNKV